MIGKFNYSGFASKILSTAISAEVSAYAFSNVDSFGAQVLCWYNDLSGMFEAQVGKKEADVWRELSDTFLSTELKNYPNSGWMSVNNRYLTPMGE